MEHILDNPAWNALISGNKHLSNGNQQVKFFDKEVSPFVGLADKAADSFTVLDRMLPAGEVRLLVTTALTDIPAPWTVLNTITGLQMVWRGVSGQAGRQLPVISLTPAHVSQMLALTKLTNPGPFAQRTIEFGHYEGIFEAGSLVAMAGQRMQAFNYAEVSAVCTHPRFTGHGFARQLLLRQCRRIVAAGQVPFLHVRRGNERAIKIYQDLGFLSRTEVHFYAVVKTPEISQEH